MRPQRLSRDFNLWLSPAVYGDERYFEKYSSGDNIFPPKQDRLTQMTSGLYYPINDHGFGRNSTQYPIGIIGKNKPVDSRFSRNNKSRSL